MKTKTLVTTGLILTLLGSNIIMGEKYVLDKNILERVIYSQAMEIDTYKSNMDDMNKLLKKQESEKDKFLNMAVKSSQQLKKVKEENTSLKKENAKLKKDLAKRKEANKRRFYVEATAYTAMCEEGCSGVTYTEIDVRNTIYYKGMRVIASDNAVLPLYSIVQVKTKNETFKAVVLDRGGGINNYEIDVLVKNESDARKFGRQKALITVLKEGNS